MIVLDTTILVYAVGEKHPLRDPSRGLVKAIQDRRLQATTTAEVIQEFVHVRSRRSDRREAAAIGRDWTLLLSPLLLVSEPDLVRGLTLYETHGRLGAFDAVLAAVAIARGADALVSGDRGFADIPGLRYVDPATSALDDLVPV